MLTGESSLVITMPLLSKRNLGQLLKVRGLIRTPGMYQELTMSLGALLVRICVGFLG